MKKVWYRAYTIITHNSAHVLRDQTREQKPGKIWAQSAVRVGRQLLKVFKYSFFANILISGGDTSTKKSF